MQKTNKKVVAGRPSAQYVGYAKRESLAGQ
jgi:hypothetical protein